MAAGHHLQHAAVAGQFGVVGDGQRGEVGQFVFGQGSEGVQAAAKDHAGVSAGDVRGDHAQEIVLRVVHQRLVIGAPVRPEAAADLVDLFGLQLTHQVGENGLLLVGFEHLQAQHEGAVVVVVEVTEQHVLQPVGDGVVVAFPEEDHVSVGGGPQHFFILDGLAPLAEELVGEGIFHGLGADAGAGEEEEEQWEEEPGHGCKLLLILPQLHWGLQ